MSKPTLPVSRLSSWVLAVAALALGCAGTSPQNREPTTSWDQQAVTDLAAQLQTSTEALYNQVREAPATITTGMENAPVGMGGSARVMHEEAGALHAKLAAGKGREDTLNAYRRIKELSRDVGESSRLTDVAAEVGAAQGGMRSILSQLDAYYGTQ